MTDHLLRSSVGLLLAHIVNQRISEYIRPETVKGKALIHIKGVIAVFIHYNMKIMGEAVSIGRKDFEHLISHAVQSQIFLPSGLITAVIFKSKRIRENVGSHKGSVSVIDVSSCTFQHTGLGRSALKLTDIILSLNDLQLKKLTDQHKRHEYENDQKDGRSFQLNFFDQFFYFSTQIDSLSFLTGVIKWRFT